MTINLTKNVLLAIVIETNFLIAPILDLTDELFKSILLLLLFLLFSRKPRARNRFG
jgi:hypothetical protein